MFGIPASKSVPYVPSFIWSFCFFLKFTLTIVEPLSATKALPGSQIISGSYLILDFLNFF